MPELAEVAWYAERWSPGLGERVIGALCQERARIYRSADARQIQRELKERRLTVIKTRGKQMLFVFGEVSLGLHLGMTGELLVAGAGYEPGRHDHLVLRQKRRSLVFRDPRMFGALKFAPSPDPEWWVALPPDISSRKFTHRAVEDYLHRRKKSPLKAVLLQQDRFPGIGNWMADEVLWRCGLHPSRRAGTLSKTESLRLWRETKKLCREAMRIIGRTWDDPPQSWLFHHRWQPGGKCPRDGTLLVREQIGGRTTAWCAECQNVVDR
ncbi:MAG: Fpg/Nei family DNA glycosylase [Chthoniobacterales bacterium]|nr:Fpg/Nei family DNA glycosylase [Chthoniobacterales bacterium]